MNVSPLDQTLYQALNVPRPPASILENNHAFHSIYGGTIVKVNGVCGNVEQIQIGMSPSNRATIGYLVGCPGPHPPTMAAELASWANKVAARQRIKP